jgi:hypothetical protein
MAVAAFPSEADMLAPIARGLPRAMWPGRPKPNLLYEFDVAAGVADIVAVEFDHRAVARRDFAGLDPVVEGLAVRVLVALRSGPMPTSELAEAAGVSVGHLRRAVLAPLAEASWVIKSRDGSWETPVQHQTLIRRAIAVEAKLRDWRTAIWQASRHRRFANLTIVVLDASTKTDAALAAVEHFRDVGLATVAAATGEVEMLYMPDWRLPMSPTEFALAGERAWEMRQAGRRSRRPALVFGRELRATRGADPRFPDAEERSRQSV